MKRIVLATSNAGKLQEFQQLLNSFSLEIIPQAQLAVPDVEETGLSFVENAIIKARNASERTGLPAIADDSGLEVDALNGAPGIYSARYAGASASIETKIQTLLDALKNQPESARQARYQCVLVYLAHAQDPTPLICQGTWEGSILFAPQGGKGFGYDPIFYVPTHQCSAAELSPSEKNKISHRGLALKKLIECLPEKLRHQVGSNDR
jgi:XTP/dITP diphosphohydrolase